MSYREDWDKHWTEEVEAIDRQIDALKSRMRTHSGPTDTTAQEIARAIRNRNKYIELLENPFYFRSE
jgi:hypothetical protein